MARGMPLVRAPTFRQSDTNLCQLHVPNRKQNPRAKNITEVCHYQFKVLNSAGLQVSLQSKVPAVQRKAFAVRTGSQPLSSQECRPLRLVRSPIQYWSVMTDVNSL